MTTIFYQCFMPCRMLGLGSQTTGDLVKSPFLPFFSVLFGLNTVPIFLGTVWNNPFNNSCPSGSHWMLWNALLCFVNIVAGFILLHKVRHPALGHVPQNNDLTQCGVHVVDPAYKEIKRSGRRYHDDGSPTGPTVTRTCKVMCEEPILGVYWFILAFWMVWLGMGIYRAIVLSPETCTDVLYMLLACIGCGVSYLAMALLAFLCSFFTSTKPKRERRKRRGRTTTFEDTDLEENISEEVYSTPGLNPLA